MSKSHLFWNPNELQPQIISETKCYWADLLAYMSKRQGVIFGTIRETFPVPSAVGYLPPVYW